MTLMLITKGGGVQSTLNNKTGGLFFFNKDRYKIETMKFTIGSSLAFGFADGWRFIKWICGAVNSQAFRIPRSSMRNIAFNYFKSEKNAIANIVASLKWNVCLTTDIATFLEFDIMCVTLHWIDVDWVLQRRIIYFRSIAKHNASEISEGLVKCMEEFQALDL